LNLVSVRKISVVCFVQLPEILIEPLFRLEQVPKRTKFKGRAEFARGDANRGHRGRVDWFAIAQRLTRRPYDRNGNGGAERRAGLQGRPAPTANVTAGELTSSGIGYTNAAQFGLLFTTPIEGDA
jgi:hypothetical protein